MPRRSLRPRFEPLERRDLMTGWFGIAAPLEGDSFSESALIGPRPYGERDPPPVPIAPWTPIAPPGPNYSHATATVADGVLMIRGDQSGRNVQVDIRDLAEGRFLVHSRGLTLINGVRAYIDNLGQSTALIFEGVTAGIDVEFGSGDDLLLIEGATAPPINIRTGGGDDRVYLNGFPDLTHRAAIFLVTNLSTSLTTNTNPTGSPANLFQPLRVNGDLSVDTGDGDDQFHPSAHVTGNATVQMGAGDDSFIEAEVLITDDTTEKLRLTAAGTLLIDLGEDQDAENIPADWRTNLDFANKAHFVAKAFEEYRAQLASGEIESGGAVIITPSSPGPPFRIDETGRLDVEFSFQAGFERVIDRLRARGVLLDAYSLARGWGRASILEEDIRLFANLPGLGFLLPKSYFVPMDPIPDVDPLWDFIRPGSPVAVGAAPTDTEVRVIAGPPRLEDLPPASEAVHSLLASYYGARFVGPRPLQ